LISLSLLQLLSAQEQIVNAFDEFKSEYRKGMQKIDKQLGE